MLIDNENNKKIYISFLRILSTLAVVFLHTNNTILNNNSYFHFSNGQKLVLSTNTVLMNWAVPVFLMITGELLLDRAKEITIKKCFNKYIRRIVLALFIFGVPFSLLEIFLNERRIFCLDLFISLKNVILGNSWSHLWYLYALIGVYLLLPFLKIYLKNANIDHMKYILSVLFVFNFIIPLLNNVLNCKIAFNIPIEGFTIFYVLMGRYIAENIVLKEFNRKFLKEILILEIVIIILLNSIFYTEDNIFLNYDSPIIALLSMTIYSLFSGKTLKRWKCKIWKLDRLCFTVYLIHPIFINFFYKFLKITPLSFGNFYPIFLVLFWILFTVLSFGGAKILYSIPFLKKNVL